LAKFLRVELSEEERYALGRLRSIAQRVLGE
jgi:hypothetical protein